MLRGGENSKAQSILESVTWAIVIIVSVYGKLSTLTVVMFILCLAISVGTKLARRRQEATRSLKRGETQETKQR